MKPHRYFSSKNVFFKNFQANQTTKKQAFKNPSVQTTQQKTSKLYYMQKSPSNDQHLLSSSFFAIVKSHVQK
jgi:hypothetical protein